jgi:hypothetical protein
MAIKTRADLRTAANKVAALTQRFQDRKTVFDNGLAGSVEMGKVFPAWRNLCRTLDRVVYAAGGHRDGCTWHFQGQDLTAQALFRSQVGDTTVSGFLFGDGQPAHTRLRLAAFWYDATARLPKPRHRAPTDLPAYRGQMLESERKRRRDIECARIALERAAQQALHAAHAMEPGPEQTAAYRRIADDYNARMEDLQCKMEDLR